MYVSSNTMTSQAAALCLIHVMAVAYHGCKKQHDITGGNDCLIHVMVIACHGVVALFETRLMLHFCTGVTMWLKSVPKTFLKSQKLCRGVPVNLVVISLLRSNIVPCGRVMTLLRGACVPRCRDCLRSKCELSGLYLRQAACMLSICVVRWQIAIYEAHTHGAKYSPCNAFASCALCSQDDCLLPIIDLRVNRSIATLARLAHWICYVQAACAVFIPS